ncbi:MAG: DM13 domain-containing protein [Iamia sp.]
MTSDPSPTTTTPPERRSRRPWYIGGGVLGLLVVAFLAFGVFGVHTLFVDDTVDEAGFEFESGAVIPDGGSDAEPTADTPIETTAPPAEAGPDATASPDPGPPEAEPEAAPAPTPTEPAIRLVATGGFSPDNHPGEGTTNIYTDGTQAVVRFEDDFSTDNGPDLYAVVYVGGERVELAPLKGNKGSQNYVLPDGIDPASIESVSVWCKRFDSTFTTATVG